MLLYAIHENSIESALVWELTPFWFKNETPENDLLYGDLLC